MTTTDPSLDTNADFIERAEQLAGCRWDDSDNPNGLYALIGAVARELGQNPHGPKDDIAAGMLIHHRLTPAYQREQATNELLLALLRAGMSPEDIWSLLK